MTLYYNKDSDGGSGAQNEAAPRWPRSASRRSRVRRRAGRGRYERETIEAILDEGLVGHVAFAVDDQPYAIPMLYARSGAELYLHGSPLSRLVGGLANGLKICVTVTIVDGLVLARSAFHHSVNYRSVVTFGAGRPIRDPGPKRDALRAIVERIMPGRSGDVRGPSDAELDATEVIAMSIHEASAKIRSGPPLDASEDYELQSWAGVLPLRLVPGAPLPDSRCEVPVPGYVADYALERG